MTREAPGQTERSDEIDGIESLPIVIDVREPPANDAPLHSSRCALSDIFETLGASADASEATRSEADALARAAYLRVQRFMMLERTTFRDQPDAT